MKGTNMKLRALRHRNSAQKHARAKIRSSLNKRGLSTTAPKTYEELIAQNERVMSAEQFLASPNVN